MIGRLTESYPIQQTPPQCVARDTFGCCLYPSIGDLELSFSPAVGDTILLQGAANPTVTLTLPAALSFSLPSQPSLSFCVYKDESLFIRRESHLRATGQTSTILASSVVGARFSGGVVLNNLQTPVRISFTKSNVRCIANANKYHGLFICRLPAKLHASFGTRVSTTDMVTGLGGAAPLSAAQTPALLVNVTT